RLLEAELVDAAVDRLLGLGDRLLPDVALALAPEAEGERLLIGRAVELELGRELLEEILVDLGGGRPVLEGEGDGALVLSALVEPDLLGQLAELLDRGRLVAGVVAEGGDERAAEIVVVAVALVLDRLVDVDGVHEPEAALEVEPAHHAEGDVGEDELTEAA